MHYTNLNVILRSMQSADTCVKCYFKNNFVAPHWQLSLIFLIPPFQGTGIEVAM